MRPASCAGHYGQVACSRVGHGHVPRGAAEHPQDVRREAKATSELGWKFGYWVRRATQAELAAAEFHAVADALLRAGLYDVLREFAVAGRRREPNEPFWRFYEIVVRTRNDPNRMTPAEEADIDEICGSQAIAEDRLGRSRIDRYLESSGDELLMTTARNELRGVLFFDLEGTSSSQPKRVELELEDVTTGALQRLVLEFL